MGEKEKIKNGVLIATIGTHSQVVTMVLNKLLADGHIIHKVIVIHTHDGGQDKDLTKSIECLKEEFIQDEDGKNISQYRLFPKDNVSRQKVIDIIKRTNNSLIEDESSGTLKIKLDMKEIEKIIEKDGVIITEPVKDIDSIGNANAAQDSIYKAVIDEMSENEIVICLAGGRKTMSADAIAALALNVKLLCHVTEPKEPFNELYQPPIDNKYELVEMLVPNIFHILEHARKNSEQYKTIFDDGTKFRENLTELSKSVKNISWLGNLTSAHELAKDKLIKLARNRIDEVCAKEDDTNFIDEPLKAFCSYMQSLAGIYKQMLDWDDDCKRSIYLKSILNSAKEYVNFNHDNIFSVEDNGIEFQNHIADDCSVILNEDVLLLAGKLIMDNAIRFINERRKHERLKYFINIKCENFDNNVKIIFENNGEGFEGGKKIPEPYKSEGGTGIALANLLDILKKYEADLYLESDGIDEGARTIIIAKRG